MTTPSSELFRIDPLTGCNTFLSFVEDLSRLPLTDLPLDYPISESLPHTEWPQDSSLLFIEINHMKLLNKEYGHVYGDSAIRWLGLALTEESNATVYRIGGVEFAILFTNGTHANHKEALQRILVRIERESKPMKMADPAVHMALIHYRKSSHSGPDNILMQMSEAMLKIKNTAETSYMVFMAEDLKVAALALTNWKATNESDVTFQTRWIARRNVQHALWMGKMLDQIQQEAYTDAISGLPNLRAALLKLEKEISSKKPFAVLLIDGDNIRRYNSINYAAGDEMIQNIGGVLSGHLRPGDFLARWRTGDEFIILLPNTSSEGARIVGDRFCSAIREASNAWTFPTSISIGIATYPKHGDNINALVDAAEMANKQAKDAGKDRVILAE